MPQPGDTQIIFLFIIKMLQKGYHSDVIALIPETTLGDKNIDQVHPSHLIAAAYLAMDAKDFDRARKAIEKGSEVPRRGRDGSKGALLPDYEGSAKHQTQAARRS